MPNPITNVALTGTAYADTATIADVFGNNNGENGGGWFEITGGSVYYSCQYAPWQPQGVGRSGYGIAAWTQDAPLSAGPGSIPTNAIGVKFRNQDAANPATVSAYIAPPGQPTLGLNGPANVTASSVATMLTGIIPATGTTPTGGTGFTYTHTNGSGVYVFTFTTPYAATPTIVATTVQATGIRIVPIITSPSATGFTVTMRTSPDPNSVVDAGFNFIAVATV